jgi:hypothetical protein
MLKKNHSERITLDQIQKLPFIINLSQQSNLSPQFLQNSSHQLQISNSSPISQQLDIPINSSHQENIPDQLPQSNISDSSSQHNFQNIEKKQQQYQSIPIYQEQNFQNQVEQFKNSHQSTISFKIPQQFFQHPTLNENHTSPLPTKPASRSNTTKTN